MLVYLRLLPSHPLLAQLQQSKTTHHLPVLYAMLLDPQLPNQPRRERIWKAYKSTLPEKRIYEPCHLRKVSLPEPDWLQPIRLHDLSYDCTRVFICRLCTPYRFLLVISPW